MKIQLFKPQLEEVKAMDISSMYHFATDNEDNRRLLRGEAGVEHYKLLAWISMQFNGQIITEIGTLGGLGTIALSFNPTNKVKSFDIRKYSWGNTTPSNAEKKLVTPGYMDEVMDSAVIFYDAQHEGKEEQEFLDELVARNWKGIIFWDDIHLNKEMREFWQNCIDAGYEVEDWTDLGHATGTGVMFLR